jgi:integrase
MSSVLKSAVEDEILIKNATAVVKLPPNRLGRKRSKPFVTPEQFDQLLAEISEPYASAVFVAIFSGLRVSELAGLRWNDVGEDTLTVDERLCRGDWGEPKSASSNATVPVNRCVIE